jgi:hypothetical protein
MKFAQRNLGLFATSSLAGRGPRRSRALRPTLGMERCEERTLLSIALVSVNPTGTAAPNANSDFVATTVDSPDPYDNSPSQSNPGSLSADGTKLVFVSDVNNLAGNPDGSNQGTAVFVRDSTTGQTSLVSATPDGQPANGDSFDPAISPNGRYVAFVSLATNLTAVAGQTPSGNLLLGTSTSRGLVTSTSATSRQGRQRFLTRRRAGRRRTYSAPVSSSSVRTVPPWPGSIARTT